MEINCHICGVAKTNEEMCGTGVCHSCIENSNQPYLLVYGNMEFIGSDVILHKVKYVKTFDSCNEANEIAEERDTDIYESYIVMGEFQGKIKYKNIDVEIDFIELIFEETLLGQTDIHEITGSSLRLIQLVDVAN